MKKNRKQWIVIKFLIIGIFLWFKLAQGQGGLFINDTYKSSITHASWSISYSWTTYDVNDYNTGIDIASWTNTTFVFNTSWITLTSSIQINIEPAFGSWSTGYNNGYYTISYTYNTGNTIAQSKDELTYQICLEIPTTGTSCATGTLVYTISDSNNTTISWVSETWTFYIQSGNNEITIDVLSNDIGTWRFLSGITTDIQTGTASITWTQYILYSYTGTNIPSNNPMTIPYQICVHNNCNNVDLYIQFFTVTSYTGAVTGVDDSAIFDIGDTSNEIIIDVLSNDLWSWLILSWIIAQATQGTAIITWSQPNQKVQYNYNGTTLPITSGTITYQVCNDANCDTANIYIYYNDYSSIWAVDDTTVFPLGSWEDSIDILVLENDIGSWLTLSWILNQPSTWSATISWTKIIYFFPNTGNTRLHWSYDSITYEVCNYLNDCDTAIITINLQDLTPISCNDDYRFYNLSWSNGNVSITRNVLRNDYYGSELTTGLFVKQIISAPSSWSTNIISSDTEINYTYYWSGYTTGDSVTIQYECCSIYNSGWNCDNADFVITFTNTTTPTEYCSLPGDEDSDGKENCADIDCDGVSVSGWICEPTGEANCSDGFDNDGDGKVDCEDFNCANQTGSWGTCEYATESICNDGFDNDADGDIDCDDSNCASTTACFSTWAEICNNQQDDDDDGLADCADPNCDGEIGSGSVVCEPLGETICNDGKDNDVDGLADCNDSQCASSSYCTNGSSSSTEICNNGKDDDIDGFADCFDLDCKNNNICKDICGNGILNAWEQCDDGNTDNDDGCNQTCKYEIPNCNNISYVFWTKNNLAELSVSSINNQSTRTTVTSISRWDNSSIQNNTTFPQKHRYEKLWTFQTQIILKNTLSWSVTKVCEESITIEEIPWCTDSNATNYDPNATVEDDSCSYNTDNLSCSDVWFSVTESQPDINETIYFLRTLNSQIKSVELYAWAWIYEKEPVSPKQYSYSLAGVYHAQLVIKSISNETKTCNLTVQVGEKWCIYDDALNFNKNASIDDWSCIFDDEGGYFDNCGDTNLDEGEECDDGNNYNGDGCDNTCFLEAGRESYCGNSIVELGEQCDWWPYCNYDCYYHSETVIDEIRKEVCYLNGQCDFGGENKFFFPEKIPWVGADDNRLNTKIKELGYQITTKPNINTDAVPWFTKKDPNNPNHEDPIYRIENILPKEYRGYKKFFVAPEIGTVASIDSIYNPTQLNDFILGKPSNIEDKLVETIVHYAGSADFGEWGNTVLLWHSSQYTLPHQKNKEIGNPFKLLPLMKNGDKFYLIEKINKEYKVHSYRVTNKKVIDPNNTEILDQRNKGNKATLVTCYPIGSTLQRMVIEAEPISKLVDISYTTVLSQLTAKQKVILRSIAQKYYKQIAWSDMFETMIQKLYLTRTHTKQRNDITKKTKNQIDTALQYIIYELTNRDLTKKL